MRKISKVTAVLFVSIMLITVAQAAQKTTVVKKNGQVVVVKKRTVATPVVVKKNVKVVGPIGVTGTVRRVDRRQDRRH